MENEGHVNRPQTNLATLWQRLSIALGWTRLSYFLMSGFVATLFVIGVVWWPLAQEALAYIDWNRPLWVQVDWLLLAKGAGAPYGNSNVLSTAGTSATPITNERNGKTSELIYSRQAPGSIAQFRVL